MFDQLTIFNIRIIIIVVMGRFLLMYVSVIGFL